MRRQGDIASGIPVLTHLRNSQLDGGVSVWWPYRCMSEISSTAQPEVWDCAGDIGPQRRYHDIWCRYSWSPENNESQQFCWLPLLIYRAYGYSDESFPFWAQKANFDLLSKHFIIHLYGQLTGLGQPLILQTISRFCLCVWFDWVMTLRRGGASFDINSIKWIQPTVPI